MNGQAPDTPPLFSYEIEQALLSACLYSNSVYWKAAGIVNADDFADAVHGRIFDAIGAQLSATGFADALTLKARFDADPALADVGGGRYLARLVAAVVTLIGAEDYAREIRDLAIRRRMLEQADAMRARVSDLSTPADEAIAATNAELQRLSGAGRKRGRTTREVATAYIEALKTPARISRTGIASLDEAMEGGLWSGKLYGFGARMKVGKSALLGTISYNLNEAGERHAYLALEMSDTELEERNIARALDVPVNRIRRNPGPAIEQRMAEYAVSVPNNRIYHHLPGAPLDLIRSVIANAIVHDGIKGLILDYMQLVKGQQKGENEEQHYRAVSQWLADFARQSGIWAVTAAQLNQDGNVRSGEGLKLACDQYYTLHREPEFSGAWLKMELSRYTAYQDLGSPTLAGLVLHQNGLWYSDAAELDDLQRARVMPPPEDAPALKRVRR